ncbi:hypothetical protein BVC80_9099g37 [Macleaya cordata]|uniref:Uncharacterized protein n=1 Tax=Macleaya cordata TaxID=56857 RepID=A0A200PVJ6_MACCD|nr:hypothetical protein BVC80_9099g37 [Macleaya cordata]
MSSKAKKRKIDDSNGDGMLEAIDTLASSIKEMAGVMKTKVEIEKPLDCSLVIKEIKKIPGIEEKIFFEASEDLCVNPMKARYFLALSNDERRIWLLKRYHGRRVYHDSHFDCAF